MQPEIRRQVLQRWLEHAASDLRVAQLAYANGNILLEQVCFHTQQCVEKCLKAALLHKQVDFPFTHDLKRLADLLTQQKVSLPFDSNQLASLNEYAVESRYPGTGEDISDEETKNAIALAGAVLDWVKSQVKP